MSVTELHPEELLDQACAGMLSSQDAHDVEAHLRRCPACAAHRRWRQDVEATLQGAGQTADRPATDALVRAVLAQRHPGAAPKPGTSIATPAAEPPGRGPRRFPMIAGAVALCLASGAAAATLWPVARRLWQAPSATSFSSPRASRAKVSLPAEQRDHPSGTAIPAIAEEPPAAGALPTSRSTSGRALSRPSPRSGADSTRERGDSLPRQPSLSLVDVPPTRESQRRPDTAAALFTELAAARRANQLASARSAHERLARGFPNTREEISGRVLLAEIALRQRDLASSLALFDSYLASDPSGTLAEEARLGRALALAGLGRPADEERAWRDLVDRHPGSIHAARARARLEALRAGMQ